LTSSDSNLSPIVNSVTMGRSLSNVDSTPPLVSNVGPTNITSSSAVISWSTNEPSTSQVQYGPTPGYGFSTTADQTLTTTHSQTLTGLAGGSLYNYRVISRDSSGNETDSANFTFTTSLPALSINDVSVVEGNSGTVTATFTVSLSAPSNQTVT